MFDIFRSPMSTKSAKPQERQELEAKGARLLLRVANMTPEAQVAALPEVLAQATEMRACSAVAELARFVDRARLVYPRDVLLHTLAAQALANLKLPLSARDVLRGIKADQTDKRAWSEYQGLLGRVNKQAFVDAQDRSSSTARAVLREAIKAYRAVYADDPKRYWHGINLVALLAQPEARGRPESLKIAAGLLRTLHTIHEGPEDIGFWRATRAETHLALGQEQEFGAALSEFLNPSGSDGDKTPPTAFQIDSLHRQLRELWQLDSPHGPLGARGSALLGVLGATLLTDGKDFQATVAVPVAAVAAGGTATDEQAKGLEKTFGEFGPRRLRWWELGLRRARSVAAICRSDSAGGFQRIGTGFLVTARPKAGGASQQFVLTNAHVIGDGSVGGMTSAAQARVRFEGSDARHDHLVAEIFWSSPATQLDATLLRLESLPPGVESLPLTASLPTRNPAAQLFIIGHPLGDELSFSFQDNLLLDHEGPPDGTPRQPGRFLLHYRTPTEPGSSGSPVFLGDGWRVVALHHSGMAAMQRLNGAPGTYDANEGIAISSISAAVLAQRTIALDLDIAAF
jgi:hypothetical protein